MHTNHENFRSFISSPDVTRIVIGFLIAHILASFITKVHITEQIENKTFDFKKLGKQLLILIIEFYGIFIFYKLVMYIRPHTSSEISLKTR